MMDGDPGRTRTRNLRGRNSALLLQLSYEAISCVYISQKPYWTTAIPEDHVFRLSEQNPAHDRLLEYDEEIDDSTPHLRDSVIIWMRDHTSGAEFIVDHEADSGWAIRFATESDLIAFMLRWG